MKSKEHEYCLRCGRKLKNEEARLKGYGEICYKKMRAERRRRLFEVNNKWQGMNC